MSENASLGLLHLQTAGNLTTRAFVESLRAGYIRRAAMMACLPFPRVFRRWPMSPPQSRPWLFGSFDVGAEVAAAHEQLARGSPLLIALCSPMDNNEGWLATGLGLQHLLLAATNLGYSTSYLNQPIEVSEFRGLLATELRAATYPQVLIRVGRGSAVTHSPRRPLTDVLL